MDTEIENYFSDLPTINDQIEIEKQIEINFGILSKKVDAAFESLM